MDTDDNIVTELKRRIQADIDVFEGSLPERYKVAWHGYLAGLCEWGHITQGEYSEVVWRLLPVSVTLPVWKVDPGREQTGPYTEESIKTDIHGRIQSDINQFHGQLPEHYAIAWSGYLAGITEWRIVKGSIKSLNDLLPPIMPPDPTLTIFTGRIYADEVETYLQHDFDAFDRQLPERYAIAWKAYLASLWEYGGIAPATYRRFQESLPPIAEPDPITMIGPDRGVAPKLRDPNIESMLEERIRETIARVQEQFLERYSIAWKAYLAGLRQWHIIQRSQYDHLLDLLSPIASPDPTATIRSVFE
jgi:hypothetical protein